MDAARFGVDQRKLDDLIRRNRERPAIAGVGVIDSAIERFAELQRLVKERAVDTLPAPSEKTPPDPRTATPTATGPSQAMPSVSDFLAGYKWVKKIGSGG